MSYSYKCYSDTKDFMKKFVNAEEGAIIYGISKSRIIVIYLIISYKQGLQSSIYQKTIVVDKDMKSCPK